MNVKNNHFVSDFFSLNAEDTSFKIPVKLSFQDREFFFFHKLSSWINDAIELLSHFLTVFTTNDLTIPSADGDDRIGVKDFPDPLMNCFRVVSFIHDITIRLTGLVILSE